jgi:hypothetical protein
MWVTGFSLAVAAAVWFSAASFAVQFNKERAAFIAAVESRPQTPDGQISSAGVGEDQPPILRLD